MSHNNKVYVVIYESQEEWSSESLLIGVFSSKELAEEKVNQLYEDGEYNEEELKINECLVDSFFGDCKKHNS